MLEIGFRLDIKDWGSVFKGESSQPQMVPKTRFFGQSVTSKTVRNADGVSLSNFLSYKILNIIFSLLRLIIQSEIMRIMKKQELHEK